MKPSRKDEYDDMMANIPELEYLPTTPFIKVDKLVKDFEIGEYLVRAVDNVDLLIREHEYIAIIGESGAGKTTLLHLLAGLDKPNAGTIHLSHINIIPMDYETLATYRIFNVGLVFQNYNLISSLTAVENVMFPMQLCQIPLDECESKAQQLLEQVGLTSRAEHLPFQLSAGEQQRVAIARALALDPPIILADEPTANLDKKNAEFIGSLFEKFQSEGKTIIVATHDEKLIKHAHRILVMEEGKIISDTQVTEISFQEKDTELKSKEINEAK
ncbi:MAG: ABC transporter ATP-binding protein [Promethearchaeota archaeon]